jgi:alpha-glucosidase
VPGELYAPHHDGSAAHVATPAGAVVASPALGSVSRVGVTVPHAAELDTVVLRSVDDGEPHHRTARRVRRDRAVDRYEVELEQVDPVQRYRFHLEGPKRSGWLTQRGFLEHDVPDTWDFALVSAPPPPTWAADAVLYQIFPDRFARAGVSDDWPAWSLPAAWDAPVVTRGPEAMRQLYGGDLPGIAEHVDHLVELGVTGVYLTPVFPAPSNHRYNATSFETVDPFLGGDEALATLARTLHDRGLRLIGDLTLNHSGSSHPWFVAAQADPAAPEAGFYLFTEHPDGYHAWNDVPSLPKFDHRDPELRRRLYEGPSSVAARYLGPPFELDGWRIDAANMAGRLGGVDRSGDLQAALLATMAASREDDAYLLAEHCHDATADLQGTGWHGTMDYSGFTRPVWTWLADPSRDVRLLGAPTPLRPRNAATTALTMDLFRGQLPWRSVVHGMNLLGSHDTARWAHVAGDRDRRHVGLVWLLTAAGIPSVFYGDELGLGADAGVDGAPDIATRQPMPWDRPGRWDHDTLTLTRRLVGLRRSSVALRRGGTRWVHLEDDVIVFLREHPDERVLVALTRAAVGAVELDAGVLSTSHAVACLDHDDLDVAGGSLRLPSTSRPVGRIWRLPPEPGWAPPGAGLGL